MNPNYGNGYGDENGYGGGFNWGSLSGALGAIGAGIGDMHAKNPADAAQPYLNQIPGMLQGAYGPYMQAGQQALPQLQQQYAAMMNPNFINNMGKSFQQSPGLQFQINQATGAANRAAAAGGYLGTPAEQQNLASVTNGLANQDYYNWLNHAMSAQQRGLQGEEGLYNTGFNAANDYAGNMGSALESQANLAYAGQQNQNQSQGGGWGSILGGLGSLAGAVGGFMFGGPGGAAAGSSLGGAVGSAAPRWF